MTEKIYQSMYEKITTSEEIDQRIREHVLQKKSHKQSGTYPFAGKMVAAVVLLFCVLQVPSVRATAMELLTHFTNHFVISEDENGENSVEMEGEYLNVSPNACKEACKMDSIAEVSENIGIKLLQSTVAEAQKDSISYYPYVSDSGALNGIILMNYFYADGPIGLEITIRSNQDEQVDYDNHELEYAGKNWNLIESSNVSNIQTYMIPQLGIESILYTVKSDGPVAWENAGVEDCESITCAIFVHEGIEYQYIGAISQETMKNFLNTLQ